MRDDDYLWDGSGEPDAQLAKLEETLGSLRWSQGKPAFREVARPRHSSARWLAAAAVLISLTGAWITYKARTPDQVTSWMLSLSGGQSERMRVGQVIETRGTTRGTIVSEFIGRVDIEPQSRLRLLAAATDQQRLALDHGIIHAFIWAPPAQFVVDTPGAKAVDLGCQYTLEVAQSGSGLLTVEMGWVAFDWQGTESFIPADAACRTRPGHGPDTPYFLDAGAVFKSAIAEFDLDGSKQALSTVLASARRRDGLSLWHLLKRAPANERGPVFDRLAELVKLPPGVTREAALRGDQTTLDATWDALDLGDTSWWRRWKRQW